LPNKEVVVVSPTNKVVVAIAASAEGQAQALASRLHEVATASWAEEGVLSYAVHTLPETPGSFMMVEVYASDAAFEAHLATEHVVAFIADLPTLVEGDLAVFQGIPAEFSSPPKGMV